MARFKKIIIGILVFTLSLFVQLNIVIFKPPFS